MIHLLSAYSNILIRKTSLSTSGIDGIDEDDFPDISSYELAGPSPLLHLPEQLFRITIGLSTAALREVKEEQTEETKPEETKKETETEVKEVEKTEAL